MSAQEVKVRAALEAGGRTLYDVMVESGGAKKFLQVAARRARLSSDLIDDLHQELFLELVTMPANDDPELKAERHPKSDYALIKTVAYRRAMALVRTAQMAVSCSKTEWGERRNDGQMVYSIHDSGQGVAIENQLFSEDDIDEDEAELLIEDDERVLRLMDNLSIGDRQVARDLLAGKSVEFSAERWGMSERAVVESVRRIRMKASEI